MAIRTNKIDSRGQLSTLKFLYHLFQKKDANDKICYINAGLGEDQIWHIKI